MIEVILMADKKVVIETLSRIGVVNKKKKILFPSCYLYDEEGKIKIAHFKELFALTRDDAYNNVSEDDILRLKSTVWNLRNWGLINVNDENVEPHNKYIFVLPFKDKEFYQISHKFNIKNLYPIEKIIN